MADEKIKAVVEPIEPRANWFNTVVGGACMVTAGRGVDIPKIPGKVSADMQLCEVSIPNRMSVYLQKKWPDAWTGKYYSRLPKLKVGTGKCWFRWAGSRYNNSLGGFSKEITLQLNQDENINIYMGLNVYYNGCASHSGRDFYNYPGVCNWTIYYKDGSNETGVFRTRYYNITHDIGSWNCSEHVHYIKTTTKPVLRVVANFVFNNAGAVWHAVGDRGPNNSAYTGQINEEGTRYFSGDITGFDIFNNFGTLPNVGNVTREVSF